MAPTPLQDLLGLDSLHHDFRAFVESVLVIAALLGAFAVRRRKRAVTSTTFILLAGSVLIDTGSRFIPNPDIGGKVAGAALGRFFFGVFLPVPAGRYELKPRGQGYFFTIGTGLLLRLL